MLSPSINSGQALCRSMNGFWDSTVDCSKLPSVFAKVRRDRPGFVFNYRTSSTNYPSSLKAYDPASESLRVCGSGVPRCMVEAQLSLERFELAQDSRVDMHRSFDHGIGRLCVHDVQYAVYSLITFYTQDSGSEYLL